VNSQPRLATVLRWARPSLAYLAVRRPRARVERPPDGQCRGQADVRRLRLILRLIPIGLSGVVSYPAADDRAAGVVSLATLTIVNASMLVSASSPCRLPAGAAHAVLGG